MYCIMCSLGVWVGFYYLQGKLHLYTSSKYPTFMDIEDIFILQRHIYQESCWSSQSADHIIIAYPCIIQMLKKISFKDSQGEKKETHTHMHTVPTDLSSALSGCESPMLPHPKVVLNSVLVTGKATEEQNSFMFMSCS